MRLRLLPLPRVAAVLLMAGWALTIAFASGSQLDKSRPGGVEPRLVASAGTGPVSISSSRDGLTILTASNLRPGRSTTGTVTITNTSSVDAGVSLEQRNLRDLGAAPKLSGVLDVLIQDVTVPSSAQTVYSGKLASMPFRVLGDYQKRTSRTYRFTVTFPSTAGSGYQGKSASVDYLWTVAKPTGGTKK